MLYFHGGYYIAGSARLCRPFLSRMAAQCRADVFAADYRLAPEHPFPAALEDAEACYVALEQSRTEKKAIFLAGDSAGAGLALALALKLLADSSQHENLAGIILISPWLDLTLSVDGLKEASVRDSILQFNTMQVARDWYACGRSYDDPLVSPLFGSFGRLPPVLIMFGGRDMLRKDARRLAKKLQLGQVRCIVQEWGLMHHCWPISPIMFPEARQAADEIGAFVRRTCIAD